MATDFAAVVMAAGLGTRMKSATPKHLHPLLGRRLVDWVVAAVRPLGPDPLVVVLSPEAAGALEGVEVAVQERPLGTGDSLRSARKSVGDARTLLVVSGDHPRISPELLRRFVEEHRSSGARSQRALVRASRPARLRPGRPRRRRPPRGDRRGCRRRRRAAGDSRGQLLHLRLRDCEAMACSGTDRAGERSRRALPDGRRSLARRGRGGSRRVQGSGCR